GERSRYQRARAREEYAEAAPNPDRKHDRTSARKRGEVKSGADALLAHAHDLRCGSTMSRRPSPSRLKQNTAIISASPGNGAIHHSPDTMKPAPSATMMPHSAVGGRTPSP